MNYCMSVAFWVSAAFVRMAMYNIISWSNIAIILLNMILILIMFSDWSIILTVQFFYCFFTRIFCRLTCCVRSLLSNVGCWWLTGLSCFFLWQKGRRYFLTIFYLRCSPDSQQSTLFVSYELGHYHVDRSNVENLYFCICLYM